MTEVTVFTLFCRKKIKKYKEEIYIAEFCRKYRHNRHIPDNQAVSRHNFVTLILN